MPSTTFGSDNVRSSTPTFPKLKLEKGQISRVVCIESGPTYEWVHNLQKPKFGIDGKPKMIWIKKKGSDEQVQDYDMEFVGTPICLGDSDVLEEKGVDSNKCPACKLAAETDFLRPPARRFAIHILQYETKAGTPNLAAPFSVRCLVWVMSEGRFTQVTQVLSEFAKDGKDVDPRQVDLILGPCENQAFQNYPIKAAQQCALTASQDNFNRGMETYKENHAADLGAFCGRKADRRYLSNDLDDIVEAWTRVRNGGVVEAIAPDVSETLDSSLLDSSAVVPPKAEESPVVVASPGAAAVEESPITEVASTQPVTQQPVTAVVPVDEPNVPDFADLLASLDPAKATV